MGMLTTIAWRNLWRNPRRTLVLVSAVGVGLFAYIGAISYQRAFIDAMVTSTLELQGGHIQVAAEGYDENPRVRALLPRYSEISSALATLEGVRWGPQVTAPGMASSAARASGVAVQGVDPVRERTISVVPERIVEGRFLEPGDTDQVVIGAELAVQLDLRLGERLVIMVSDLDNEVGSGAYRIAGLFRTASTAFDRQMVFLPLAEAQRLLAYGQDSVSVVTVRLDPHTELEEATAAIRDRLGVGIEVLTWRDRNPMLVLSESASRYAAAVLMLVLFTGVGFTIVNSFLMVIFERIHEIGVLLAGGIRPWQVRRLLYLEALFVVAIGIALGAGLAGVMVGYLGSRGIDMSAFAEALGAFGISAVIYPAIDPVALLLGLVLVVVMVLLAVLYPAWKASRFDPVEAINHV